VLARGSTAELQFNLAIFFLPIALSFLVTLVTTPIPSIYQFIVFAIIVVGTFIAGLVLLLQWWHSRRSSKNLLNEIKARMPPEAGIQESLPDGT